MVTFGIFGGFLGLLFLPLERSVNIPAVLVAAKEAQYYAPVVAQVEQVLVKPGVVVKKGDALLRLSSPEYKEFAELVRLKLALVQKRLDRGGADSNDLDSRAVLLHQVSALRSELAGLKEKTDDLVLLATIGGVVSEIATGLSYGLWVN